MKTNREKELILRRILNEEKLKAIQKEETKNTFLNKLKNIWK
jgi:hypothetical protein